MIAGQVALRVCAAVAWTLLCVLLVSAGVNAAATVAVMAGVAALFAFLMESGQVPMSARAALPLLTILALCFLFTSWRNSLLLLPFGVILVTLAAFTFLNRALLIVIAAAVHAMLLTLLLLDGGRTLTGLRVEDFAISALLAEGVLAFTIRFVGRFNRCLSCKQAIADSAQSAAEDKIVFLANMAEEIRSPAIVLDGISEVMGGYTDQTPREDITASALMIKAAGQSLISLVDDTLESIRSKPRAPGPDKTYRVADVIAGALADYEVMMGPPVLAESDFHPHAALLGDARRVRHTLFRLLLAAGRSSSAVQLCARLLPAGPHVDLLFELTAGVMSISNPEWRVAERLAASLGGALEIGPNRGSAGTVIARLPQRVAPDAAPPAAENAPEMRSRFEGRVLVVDDNHVNLSVAASLLRLFGILTDTARSGTEALGKTAGAYYDLILMDHMMPGMDGVETTARIRGSADPWYRDVPIVALTANAAAGMADVFLSSGMDAFLPKPILLPALEDTLKRFLPPAHGKPEAHEEMTIIYDIPFIPGVDRDIGLMYCGGTPDGYRGVLETFAVSAPAQLRVMADSLASGDTARLGVEAHALKSAARTIGATVLGESAYALETACKRGDTVFVGERAPALLKAYGDLAGFIRQAVKPAAMVAQDAPPMEKEALIARLTEIADAADDFRLDDAQAAAEDLLARTLDAHAREGVELIRNEALQFSYSGVADGARKLMAWFERE